MASLTNSPVACQPNRAAIIREQAMFDEIRQYAGVEIVEGIAGTTTKFIAIDPGQSPQAQYQ